MTKIIDISKKGEQLHRVLLRTKCACTRLLDTKHKECPEPVHTEKYVDKPSQMLDLTPTPATYEYRNFKRTGKYMEPGKGEECIWEYLEQ